MSGNSTIKPAKVYEMGYQYEQSVETCMNATGAFFNGKFWLFSYGVTTDPPSSQNFFGNLFAYAPEITLTDSGSYSMDQNWDPVNVWTGENENVIDMQTLHWGDELYIFALTDTNFLAVWKAVASETAGEIVVSAEAWLQLVHPVTSFTAVAGPDRMKLYFTSNDTARPLQLYFFFGTELNYSSGFSVAGPQYPCSNINSAIIHRSEGVINRFIMTDSAGDLWRFDDSESHENVHKIQLNDSIENPIACLSDGPLVGQTQEVADVYFISSTSQLIQSAYLQSSSVLTSFAGQPVNKATNMFAADAFVEFPDDSGNLFRFIVFGRISLGKSIELFLFPNGQLMKGEAKKIPAYDNPPPGQETAFYSSWSLVGIVQGAPPFPRQGDKLPSADFPKIDILFTHKKGATLTSKFGASITIGWKGETKDKLFNAGASFSSAFFHSQKTTKSHFSTLNLDINTRSDFNQGALIFLQHCIVNQPFEVFSPEGISLDYSVHIMSVTETQAVHNAYNLTNPNGYAYSAGMSPLPSSDDIDSWQKSVMPLPLNIQIFESSPVLSTGPAGGSSSGFGSEENVIIENNSTNKVQISAGAFGFSETVEGSYEYDSQVVSEFTKSFETHVPGTNELESLVIRPYVIQLEQGNVGNIVPWLYQDASPWLVTWRVESFIPKNEEA